MAPPYPTTYQIEEMFSNRSNANLFNSYLAENFEVTVVGKDFTLGGKHKSMQAFHDGTYGRISAILNMDTVSVEVVRVIGGGESSWAAVETFGTAITKSNKPFNIEYVDLVRFNSQGKIAQMKEFLDNGHIQNHLEENEGQQQQAK
ncbi:MAG: hypothetical protein Q9191_003878 [Dirinaria sp. TL-2023a]